MGALPQDAGRRQAGRETEILVEALQSEAEARDYVHASDERLRAVINGGAEELVYRWQTPDQREAEMRVHFRQGEDVDLLAAQLRQIDYRTPTAQERARYEDEFEAELAAAGELWLQVYSHIAN